jgi:hypothetical protein
MSRRNTLTPEMERELDELDATLAGEGTDAGLAEIVALVREERPPVDTDFARELDELAAEGFPRKGERGRASSSGRGRLRLPDFLRTRQLVPALGVAATLLIGLVVVTAVITQDNGGTLERSPNKDLGTAEPQLAAPKTTEDPLPSAVPESGAAAGDTSTIEPTTVVPPADESGVPGRRTRKQELTASLTLGTTKKKFDDVAAKVLKTTNRYGGVVMRSDVSSTSGAEYDLRIPADKLQAALAALSELGDVESRDQTSTDITAAFVSPRERLTDGLAERKALLKQLAKADTPNETASIRERLRVTSQQIAVARGRLRGLQERTNFAKVSVQVYPRGSVGGGAGEWGVGDGLDDGLRILTWLGGALIVALAVSLPFILLGGLGTGAARALRRRRRESALDAV